MGYGHFYTSWLIQLSSEKSDTEYLHISLKSESDSVINWQSKWYFFFKEPNCTTRNLMMLQTMKMPQVYKTRSTIYWMFSGADFLSFYSTGSQRASSGDHLRRFWSESTKFPSLGNFSILTGSGSIRLPFDARAPNHVVWTGLWTGSSLRRFHARVSLEPTVQKCAAGCRSFEMSRRTN
jgi:hypothetical protein